MTTSTEDDCYYLTRGSRVEKRTEEQISSIAKKTIFALGLKKKDFHPRHIEKNVLMRLEDAGIHIDIVEDSDWHGLARAVVDTAVMMIYMPMKLYQEILRARPSSMRILLHELGHIILCHQGARLAYSDAPHEYLEDSEWQADTFADKAMDTLGLDPHEIQIEFEF